MANVLNIFAVNISHQNMTPIAALSFSYELEKESVKFWLIPRPHSGGSCNWGPLYQHNGNPLCQLTSRHRWLRFVCNFGRVATSSPHPHLYIVYIYIFWIGGGCGEGRRGRGEQLLQLQCHIPLDFPVIVVRLQSHFYESSSSDDCKNSTHIVLASPSLSPQ